MTVSDAARPDLHYELRIRGHLDRHWSTWFGGLALTHEDDGTTTLRGAVTDQAELHGLLSKVRDLGVTLVSLSSTDVRSALSPTRLNLMRAGYLLMGVGLALVKWPLLAHAATLPLHEGVTLCLLTAMSLLALLGLRHPVALLPVLVFESLWKLLWLALVALPRATTGSLDAATTETVVNCSLVVVILAVTPWPYVWRHYVLAAPARRPPGSDSCMTRDVSTSQLSADGSTRCGRRGAHRARPASVAPRGRGGAPGRGTPAAPR